MTVASCPECGAPMIRKYSSKYRHSFLSCSRYPSCRGTLSLRNPAAQGRPGTTSGPKSRTGSFASTLTVRSASEDTDDSTVLQRLIHFYDACLERESLRELRFRESDEAKSYVALGVPPDTLLAGAGLDIEDGPQSDPLVDFVRARKVGAGARRLYIGYPVAWLSSRDDHGRELVPLMYGALDVVARGSGYRLSLQDAPQVNYLLLERAGLSLEEAVTLGAEIEALAHDATEGSWKSVLAEQIARVAAEAQLTVTDSEPGQGPSSLADLEVGAVGESAILFQGDGVGYTVSVRTELRRIAADPSITSGTPVEQLLSGSAPSAPATTADIVPVTPLSQAQREAVIASFSRPLTVVTGPPGTGKSQLVLNIVANALIRGETLLFASRNNKAVDVVCERFAGLTDEAALLRTGRANYRDAALALMRRVVAGVRGPSASELGQSRTEMQRLSQIRLDLEGQAKARSDAEALVEERSAQAESVLLASSATAREVAKAAANAGYAGVARSPILERRLDELERYQTGRMPLRVRLASLVRRGYALAIQQAELTREATQIGGPFLDGVEHCATLAALIEKVHPALSALRIVEAQGRHRDALGALARLSSRHDLAAGLAQLGEQEATAGSRYVRLARQATLSHMPDADREVLEQYLRVVEQLAGPEVGAQMYARLKQLEESLFSKIQAAFPVWALTSLTARRNLPLRAGLFDLVVIDEASQCDVPSALALMVRGRRAVVIGDDKQLVHITPLARETEHALANEAGLSAEELVDFSYREVSLFTRARQVAMRSSDVLLLDEHYRSDPDIITFSNDHFYGGRLRIYTEPQRLLSRGPGEHAIQWVHVQGETVRPPTGSAENQAEAREVVRQLVDLVTSRDGSFTIGVVTPFRRQKELIESLLSQRLTPGQVEAYGVTVDTAHGFQGDERDVMLFSPVLSGGALPSSIDFVNSNSHLFNVAVTRARSRLIVCGDRVACQALGGLLADLAAYVASLESDRSLARMEAQGAFDTDEERQLYEVLAGMGFDVTPHRVVRGCEIDLSLEHAGIRLAIEVDGTSHRPRDGTRYLSDSRRDLKLEAVGWRVLRIPAWRVRTDQKWCRDAVSQALGSESVTT